MPSRHMQHCHILNCECVKQHDKTEISSGFHHSNAAERDKLVESERKFTGEKVKQVIAFNEGESVVVINQKDIDPVSLHMLAKERTSEGLHPPHH